MAWWRRTTACERAGQWISLRLDGELTDLERAALNRHLERCERCGAYAAELGSITQLLREAPLVEPQRSLVALPVRSGRKLARRAVLGLAIAGAAASAAASLVFGLGSSHTSTSALGFRSAQEQIRFLRAEQHRLEPAQHGAPAVTLAPQVAARSL
jgi:anti-sigma factor RsiW